MLISFVYTIGMSQEMQLEIERSLQDARVEGPYPFERLGNLHDLPDSLSLQQQLAILSSISNHPCQAYPTNNGKLRDPKSGRSFLSYISFPNLKDPSDPSSKPISLPCTQRSRLVYFLINDKFDECMQLLRYIFKQECDTHIVNIREQNRVPEVTEQNNETETLCNDNGRSVARTTKVPRLSNRVTTDAQEILSSEQLNVENERCEKRYSTMMSRLENWDDREISKLSSDLNIIAGPVVSPDNMFSA